MSLSRESGLNLEKETWSERELASSSLLREKVTWRGEQPSPCHLFMSLSRERGLNLEFLSRERDVKWKRASNLDSLAREREHAEEESHLQVSSSYLFLGKGVSISSFFLEKETWSERDIEWKRASNLGSLSRAMGWLRLVGPLKWYVFWAKEPYKRDYILQKRPIILRSLLIVATP